MKSSSRKKFKNLPRATKTVTKKPKTNVGTYIWLKHPKTKTRKGYKTMLKWRPSLNKYVTEMRGRRIVQV